MSDPSVHQAPPSARPHERAGLPVLEYHWRVRDMAKSVLHAAGIYVVAEVAAMSKLLGHPWFEATGLGGWREIAVFGAGFLGAWAVVLSTLLRDAGLRSWTVTLLVPFTVVVVAAVCVAFPPAAEMSSAQLAVALAGVSAPGPIAWGLTLRRWRMERSRAARLLAGESE